MLGKDWNENRKVSETELIAGDIIAVILLIVLVLVCVRKGFGS